MAIFAAAILPSITFEIKRDREEELIHRGVQYSRAIRAYYKKFGRYPTKLEDLESANNLRFLRKRYKDPITGQDFKLLHFGEVRLTFSGAMGVGGVNGANPLNNPNGLGAQPQPGGLNAGSNFSNAASAGAQNSFGANSNTLQGNNPNGPQGNSSANTPTDQNQNADPNAPQQPSGPQQPGTSSGDQLSGQTFGGGPVVGVASSSKKDTIREFNHKKKYNEWQFIYDPGTDRGGLLTTPNQPALQAFGAQQGIQNNNGLGNNGMGLQPQGVNVSPAGPGYGTTNQPNNPPQQQSPQQQ